MQQSFNNIITILNMRKIITSAFLTLPLLLAVAQIPYKVTVPIPDVAEGTIAYMTDFDSGNIVDSVAVAAQKAYFTGDVDEPFVVRITAGGKRYGTLILEQGASAVNQESHMGVGSMLNDQLMEISKGLNEIGMQLQQAESDEQAQELYNNYLSTERQAIIDNIDNPIGYYLFIDYATSLDDVNDMLKFLEEYPSLKEYNRVQKLINNAERVIATSVGQPYADFEVEYNGATRRLSDYVGNGNYVLADFWASWCGPCRREIKTLKEINEAYGPKGLVLLGVAVWDKPEDTEKAIEQLSIPWDCIINAQNIPTDIYGIPAIPCIILFSPEGMILSRGKQGADLKADVSQYFE